MEVDARTGFTDHLVHAGGQVIRSAELKRHLLYVITAEATNMGLGEMAASAEISDEALAWTAEWYFRPETLEATSGKKQQNALTSAMNVAVVRVFHAHGEPVVFLVPRLRPMTSQHLSPSSSPRRQLPHRHKPRH